MAAHWDMGDLMLLWQLNQFVVYLLVEDNWLMNLYKNDYTPVPGSSLDDYEVADFPGYEEGTIVNANWEGVAVLSHVAVTTNTTPILFTADASGFSDQTIYGYYVTDGTGEYRYGERFASPKTVVPSDIVSVTAILKMATYPNP